MKGATTTAMAIDKEPTTTAVPSAALGTEVGEIVVRGTVVRSDQQPIRHAVVTVLHTTGEPVDWSRADNDGAYSVVLPGAGRYLVVSSADGWAPKSQVLELTDATPRQQIRLSERLTISGTVRNAGGPLDQALVTLTKPTGESVTSTHSQEGRYELPLPAAGRYILTTLDPSRTNALAKQVLVATQPAVVDFDYGASGSDGFGMDGHASGDHGADDYGHDAVLPAAPVPASTLAPR
jgi:hypothetical protein